MHLNPSYTEEEKMKLKYPSHGDAWLPLMMHWKGFPFFFVSLFALNKKGNTDLNAFHDNTLMAHPCYLYTPCLKCMLTPTPQVYIWISWWNI